MSIKRSLLSVVLIFVVAIIWNGLFHMVLIAEQNEMIASIQRPDMSEKLFLSLFITIGMATLFVVSYNKWRRSGTLIESLIHGIFFSVLAGVLVNANQYLVYPIPGMLAVLWFLGGLVEFSLYSIIVWLVQRNEKLT
ncbi:hypothetical protein [Thiomicrorhabdus sp.]|uniref:hypothetical protein n=1 Tax=Thiomicrorhabdus sp. TaxID=2039724 RepID=UPI002AA65911|nr:hypothetical protein [Thiomicrorhabdus sp.]